jgi:hypothetical protein
MDRSKASAPPTTLERAFDLAGSGRFDSLEGLRRQLRAEQLTNIDGHLAGAQIRRQLRGIISDRRRAAAEPV